MPLGETSIDPLVVMTSANRIVLKDILEETYAGEDNSGWITSSLTADQREADKANFMKMQGAYLACMNVTKQAEAGLRPLKDLAALVSTLYPVPALSNATKREAQAQRGISMGNTLSYFESLGIQTFTSLSIQADDYDPVST